MGPGELIQHGRFGHERGLASITTLPSDQPLVAAINLPQVASAPVPDRSSGPEPAELTKTALEIFALANVGDRRPLNPLRRQDIYGHGGIVALEVATSTSLSELRNDPFN